MAHRPSFVQMAALALVLATAPLAAPPTVMAQAAASEPQGAAADPIARRVFPPDLIMDHADQIGLTPNQRDRIIAEVKTLQSRAEQVAPVMERARAQMVSELDAEPTNEARLMSALDSVLAAERDIKRLHIATLVRIRNLLTPAQRARLNALR